MNTPCGKSHCESYDCNTCEVNEYVVVMRNKKQKKLKKSRKHRRDYDGGASKGKMQYN